MSQAGHVAASGAAQQWGKQPVASFVISKKDGGRGRKKKEGVGRGKRDREGGEEGRRKDTERKTEREPYGCETLGSRLARSCYKHAMEYCTII